MKNLSTESLTAIVEIFSNKLLHGPVCSMDEVKDLQAAAGELGERLYNEDLERSRININLNL